MPQRCLSCLCHWHLFALFYSGVLPSPGYSDCFSLENCDSSSLSCPLKASHMLPDVLPELGPALLMASCCGAYPGLPTLQEMGHHVPPLNHLVANSSQKSQMPFRQLIFSPLYFLSLQCQLPFVHNCLWVRRLLI